MKCPDCNNGKQQRWDDFNHEMLVWDCLSCGGKVMVWSTFGEWFKELQKLCLPLYGFTISDDDKEDWEEFYEDGYTPREALNEDMNCG